MKIAGVAPKIAIPTFLYIVIAAIIDYMTKPFFTIAQDGQDLVVLGIVLILIGAVLITNVARKLQRSFKSNTLMTDGLYSVFRNPMYAAYLIYVIPGFCLFFNSWLVLSAVILNFILLQIFIKEEYKYLEDKFGEEYKSYLKNVWVKFL